MFKLNNLTPDNLTSDQIKGCQALFDSLADHEKQRVEKRRVLKQKESEHSPFIAAIFKERVNIKAKNDDLILALNTLINQVNTRWSLEDKAKLIKGIISTSNEQLITFTLQDETSKIREDKRLSTSFSEDKRLSTSFSDYIKKRDSSNQKHQKLKVSLSI